MAWTNITNAAVAAGAALTTALMTALRDNLLAVVSRDPTAPKLQTDFQFLDRQVASGDATLDFTAFDATKYDAYVFELANIIPSNNADTLGVQTSTDGGSTYDNAAAAYRWVFNAYDTADASSNSAGATSIALSGTVGSGTNEDGWSGSVAISGAGLTKFTRVCYRGGFLSSAGQLTVVNGIGERRSSADVDAIRFLFSAGNIESGIITMYGLRND